MLKPELTLCFLHSPYPASSHSLPSFMCIKHKPYLKNFNKKQWLPQFQYWNSCLWDSGSDQRMKSLWITTSSTSFWVMISLSTSSLTLIFARLSLGKYQVKKKKKQQTHHLHVTKFVPLCFNDV